MSGDENPTLPPAVDGGDVLIAPPEVMRQLVDEDMGDEAAEGDIAPVRPFVEDRAAEKPDGVWLGGLVEGGFFGEGDAVVKAGERERVIHFEIGEHGVAGEILDPERDGAGDGLDVFWEGIERGIGEGLELGEVGGGLVGPVHGVGMDAAGRIGKVAIVSFGGSAPSKSFGFGFPGIFLAR